METLFLLFGFLQKAAFSVGPFFLLLGVLIFIHELGHFVVARYFGVKVETFSLGFGPKILKYKKGGTVYCISLLPLGGYVKMYGDNPLNEPPDSKKHQAFLYKKPYQKWLIAFAGPFVNLVFTVTAFFIMALAGTPSLPPEIGDVQKASPAWQAGFRSGDRVLSLNGQKLDTFTQLEELIQGSQGADLTFEVQGPGGQSKKLSAAPKQKTATSLLGEKKTVFGIEGLTYLSTGLKLGVIYDSPAWRAGLRTFDTIQSLDGQKLKYWRDFKKLIEGGSLKGAVPLTAKREGKVKKFELKIASDTPSLKALGFESSDLYIETVGPDTPARQAGLQKGDRLIAIDDELLTGWPHLLEKVQSYGGLNSHSKDEIKGHDQKAIEAARSNPLPFAAEQATNEKAFALLYQRQAQTSLVSIIPKAIFVEGNIKKRFMLGIRSGVMHVVADPAPLKRSVAQSASFAGAETWRNLSLIVNFISRIVTGDISFRALGGPVAIGRVAYHSFQNSFYSFFSMMAFISLNLFFLNLLPIPMLDGGHLLFFSIEGLLRRPVNVKKLLIAQQFGAVLLISFMGFALFNDIYNWLKAW